MKLKKRDCKIKVNIEPLGAELLYVCFDFGYDKIEFTPSTAAMSNEQFGEFVCALYTLYAEKNSTTGDGHNEWRRREHHSNSEHRILATTTIVDWDGDFYCAVRYANAKADVFGMTYYSYNCKYKKVVKACSGWGYSGCYRIGIW
jgi:hypothetical protein